jgi:hypothetical protein
MTASRDNLHVVSQREGDNPRNQSVLWRAIDEGAAFENGGNGKHGARRYFGRTNFDGAKDVVGGVVDP